MENSLEPTLDVAALAQILEQHKLHLETGGREGQRANLRGANLRGANLSDAQLSGADLSGVNLCGADLSCSNLQNSCLVGADLKRAKMLFASLNSADLAHASLSGAELDGADLDDADLRFADLGDASLIGASLRSADLGDASLIGANLRYANLRCANLRFADLRKSCLNGAELKRAKMRGALGFSVLADAPGRLLAVARVALAEESALDMAAWHTCETTHCVAGWAIHLAGEKGQKLEESYGPEVAGRMLLGHEAAMHFHDDDSEARLWLQSVLDAAEVDQSAPAAIDDARGHA